jgi:hypothetical protein
MWNWHVRDPDFLRAFGATGPGCDFPRGFVVAGKLSSSTGGAILTIDRALRPGTNRRGCDEADSMPNVPQPPAGKERTAPNRRPEPQSTRAEATPESVTSGSEWTRLFSSRWLIGAVAISFLLEAAIIYWFRMRSPQEAAIIAEEIPLGSFEFSRSGGVDKQIYRGQFDLFVRLSDHLESSERQQFMREQPRLQQAVEEALRRLRLADFTDLRLSRLKTHVQERLNDELGFDAVAEVLVSNFKINAFRPIQPAAPKSD